MDWLKLFALVVAVTSVHITADSPKKKIRIHLPQKVKHIHHHKKIYITNHPASSQYAPAFMPSAESAMAEQTNGAMPAVASVLNSVEVYDESPMRMPGVISAISKLLPLYRTRGYYGPAPEEWDEQGYDLDNPEQTEGSYANSAFESQSTDSSNYPPQKIKVIKLNEPTRKKAVRKNKLKRVPFRNKPQSQVEDEHPVTTFHEQFYSDLDNVGTIKKLKKPPRVEKIIDGDTEHIHTYSEEHIHKLVYGDRPKAPRIVGIEPVGNMPHFAPLKNTQAIIAISPDALTGYTAIGSLATPSNSEDSSYNPRDVTHDHIFHDHGEVPSNVDLTKNHLQFPPRATYSSQGLRIGGIGGKGIRAKNPKKYFNAQMKPNQLADFSYPDQMYAPYNNYRHLQKPTSFELSNEETDENRFAVPSFKLKQKGTKARHVASSLYYGLEKNMADYRQQQASVSSPYSMSSTVIHEYTPKYYSPRVYGSTKLNKDPSSNYEYDTLASSSNVYTAENYPLNMPIKKGKKKSVSTQNIHLRGLDQQKAIDHVDSDSSGTTLNAAIPSAFDNSYDQRKPQETPLPTAFTIRELSPVHPYYRAMAMKALQSAGHIAESSDVNYQYAEAPSPSNTDDETVVATVATPTKYFEETNSEPVTTQSTDYDTRPRNAIKSHNSEVITEKVPARFKIIRIDSKVPTQESQESEQNFYKPDSVSVTGKFKYGDKI